MFKLRIGFFLNQYKLCIRSSASILKTRDFSSCSKATSTSKVTNNLKSSLSVVIPSRTFWETYPGTGRSFHARDGLDRDNHELVYRNKLFNYVFYGQLMSELTFLAQIGYGLNHIIRYFLAGKVEPLITTMGSFTVTYDLLAMGALIFFTIQNCFIFMAAQKVLLRAYHKTDTDEYVFISLALNPFKIRKAICKPGELTSLQTNIVTTFLLGNFETNDRRYYLRHEHFKTNYHYNRLVYKDY